MSMKLQGFVLPLGFKRFELNIAHSVIFRVRQLTVLRYMFSDMAHSASRCNVLCIMYPSLLLG